MKKMISINESSPEVSPKQTHIYEDMMRYMISNSLHPYYSAELIGSESQLRKTNPNFLI